MEEKKYVKVRVIKGKRKSGQGYKKDSRGKRKVEELGGRIAGTGGERERGVAGKRDFESILTT